MRQIIDISLSEVEPVGEDVLGSQGIPPGAELPKEVKRLFDKAVNDLFALSEPRAVFAEISVPGFATVYAGEGLNEKETPLGDVLIKAEGLMLFAVTLGDAISNQIDELFKTNEFALGSMLDSAASVAAENVADVVQDLVFDILMEEKRNHEKAGIMRFSAGYCGWHMSGQRKLFEFLCPEDIGITLLDSYLMKPLKSISGVMVAGEKNIFVFEDSYPFCSQCNTHSCRDRIRELFCETKSKQRKGAI
jgi:hypothetical protein